jgi:DNA-binding NarL/FixJ family response regulator
MLQRLRVIIADDHASVRTAVRRILEPHCEVVAVAINGEDLLRQVADMAPNVVVTDVAMPMMNGFDACRVIRRTYPLVSVVIVTALVDDDLAVRASDVGASALVQKMNMAWELPGVVLALR